jgi:Uma2 family endonuclease
MSAVAEKLVTAVEYARVAPTDRPGELVRGRVVVMNSPPTAHDDWCGRLSWRLNSAMLQHCLGRVITDDGGVPTEHDPDPVRGVDVACDSYDRVPRGPLPKGYWPAPELAVEVKSPDDRWTTIHKTLREDLDAGVLTVVVAHPENQLIPVTTPDRETKTLKLDVPDSLAGLSVPVREIFET